MKTKNPLYVVKGQNVLEAKNVFDLVVKKLNLEMPIEIIMNIFKMLLDQVMTYPAFLALKNKFDEMMVILNALAARFGIKGLEGDPKTP